MDNYLTRLATFFSFPFPSAVSTTTLAEAGFHYTGNKDEVICHACNLKYSGWQRHDDPLAIHKAMSPRCIFVLKTDVNMSNDDHSTSISSHDGVENQQEGMKCVTERGEISGILDQETTGGAVGGPLDHVTYRAKEPIRQARTDCDQQASSVLFTEADSKKRTDLPQNVTDPNLASFTAKSSSYTGQINGHVRENMDDITYNVPDNRTGGKQAHGPLHADEPIVGSHIPETERSGEDYPSTSRSGQEPVNDTESHVGIDSQISQQLTTVQPRYPQFAILAVRLASYKDWPTNLRQRPEELAKAGLFYEGTKDYVRCFHCAGGLREWEPEDDPVFEHARWFPFCEFMRLIKGDQFIIGVQAGTIKAEPKVQCDEKPVAPKQQYPFDHPAVLSVMEMGYKRETIAKAIQLFNKRNGKTLHAETLLSIVWEIVEDDGYISDDEDNSKTKEMIPDEIPEKNEDSKDDVVSYRQSMVQDVNQLEEENRALRERKTCKVCLDEEASIVFLPCGHLVTCPMCASALRKCPICRSFIRGTVKAIVS